MSKDSSVNKDEENSSKQNEKEEEKKEIGGYKGLDPTSFGDWQHKGRVTDF